MTTIPGGVGGAVDYEGRAATYRRARTLPPDVMASWDRTVRGLGLPALDQVVLDVGAGPGGFLEALRGWFGGPVVAVEPSAAMRAAAVAGGLGQQFGYVAGRAEALPVASSSVNGAWLSTVVHQVANRAAAVRELHRTVRPGGWVLVRGFFADVPSSGLLSRFPGIERSALTFPSTAAVTADFEAGGFGGPAVIDVAEPWTFEVATWAERVWSMRDVDSMLRPLTDAEVSAGIAAVRAAHGDTGPVRSDTVLRLLVFYR